MSTGAGGPLEWVSAQGRASNLISGVMVILGIVIMAVTDSIGVIILGFVVCLIGAFIGLRGIRARRMQRQLAPPAPTGANLQQPTPTIPPGASGAYPTGVQYSPPPPPATSPPGPQAAPPLQSKPPAGRTCVACGTGNPQGGVFCTNCGKPLPPSA